MDAFRPSYNHAVSELFCLQTIRDCVSLRLPVFFLLTQLWEGLVSFWGENQVKKELELGLRNLPHWESDRQAVTSKVAQNV